MAITAASLKEKLLNHFGATHVDVTDVSGSGACGLKFEVVVVSTQFEGKRLLERHRMVHECLTTEMPSIHALTQKTYTPEQWEKVNSAR